MSKMVLEFQEEVLGITSGQDLKDATTRAMTRLDFPFFVYAWNESPFLDEFVVTEDTFFASITNDFFVPYMKERMFLHDFSIDACRGTTTIPSLIGKAYHRWRNVPRRELTRAQWRVENMGRAFFVDGMTGRIENYRGRFFAGASLIGQGRSKREFDAVLNANAGMAFQILRIHHDRFHDLRRDGTMISLHPSELQYLVATARTGDVRAMETRVAALIRQATPGASAPEAPFLQSEGYSRVRSRGRIYSFGPTQASVIRMLHAAHLVGNPWIEERILLENAQSGSRTLRELFKNHGPELLFEKDDLGRVRLKI